MKFESWFHDKAPSIAVSSALAVIEMQGEGATVPFMARYRKERTGNLDEVAIQKVITLKEDWDEILKRKAFILDSIEKQNKLTPDLKKKIEANFDPDQLEDIYLPFKQKKKSKALVAKEAGLEPLADFIWAVGHGKDKMKAGSTIEQVAAVYVNKEKGIESDTQALAGATDIIVEKLAEMPHLRQKVREKTFSAGLVESKRGKEPKESSKYDRYFEYIEPISSLLKPENSHRYLALQRGWNENELSVSVHGPEGFEQECISWFEKEALTAADSPVKHVLLEAATQAYRNYVNPGIETEVHRSLKKVADEVSAHVFSENVKKVLLAPPFGPQAVLGIDPGVRTGCKVALVNASGKFIDHFVFYAHDEAKLKEAQTIITKIIKEFDVKAIAIGNGTAGRETESFIRKMLKEEKIGIPVVMVNESGASIYSASETAREEFPDLDVTVRGAISIARRFQDPLAELVKVDPKSIGVGQYQHDIAPSLLKKSLDSVVESAVNTVGVDLNTASKHLLSHVSGIGPGLGAAIEDYRGKKGLFKNRESLLEVPRFSQKVYHLAVGFLRVRGGDNPLDNTGVHPEQYPVLETFAKKNQKSVADYIGKGATLLHAAEDLKAAIGAFTFEDIVNELKKPGRDPRDNFTIFQFREDTHSLEDLQVGMTCPGIVTNVTNFGAFVDIGVHQDGLVHLSEMSYEFVKDPKTVVHPGDHVQVKILKVDKEKRQISLSMKLEPPPPRPEREPREARDGARDRRPRDGGRGPRPGPMQGGRDHRGQGKGRSPDRGPERPRKEKTPFNPAFADLAKLRDSLKPK